MNRQLRLRSKPRERITKPYRGSQSPAKELSRDFGFAVRLIVNWTRSAATRFRWLALACLASGVVAAERLNCDAVICTTRAAMADGLHIVAPEDGDSNLASATLASAQVVSDPISPSSAADAGRPTIAAPAAGKLRILVVPAFWSDYAEGEPVSVARVAELMSMVRAYYFEASYGKLEMVPTVTPWIRLSVPRPPAGVPTRLRFTPRSHHRTIASYRGAGLDRIVVIQPRVAEQCFWHGIASGSSAWINGVFDEKVIGHELGHTLGLGHAHQLNCGAENTLVLRACRVVVTGDFYAVMGKWNMGHLMAMHKTQLGWITPLTHGSGVAEYDLTAISAKGGALYAVKVVRGSRTFWIERREPSGFDAAMPGAGIVIRVVDSSIGCGESCILNMSASGDDFLRDAALKSGRSGRTAA